MHSDIANLRLFQLISPALPIGSFTYSQGMEWNVETGWVDNPSRLIDWLESILKDNLAMLDLPLLFRLLKACKKNDTESFSYWSHFLLANRETQELRQEELSRARALLTLLRKLPDGEHWKELDNWREALMTTQASGFSLAAYHWQISNRQMLMGYAWSWLENAVTAAIKLIPLGQSDGQIVLHRLSNLLPNAIDLALSLKDDEIGASTPALAIASSLHETQYTRLFRS